MSTGCPFIVRKCRNLGSSRDKNINSKECIQLPQPECAYMHVLSVFTYVLNVHALMSAEISDKDLCGCCNLLSMAVTQNLSNLESMTTSQRHICTCRTLINHVTTFFPSVKGLGGTIRHNCLSFH